jgi:hypothetical protein
VLFNVIQSVPVIFTLNAADAVLTLASLGFLGFGVQPPTPEWGYDISSGGAGHHLRGVVDGAVPGFAIVTLVTALTLVGEGLNDVINPLLRARGQAGAKLDDAAESGERDARGEAQDERRGRPPEGVARGRAWPRRLGHERRGRPPEGVARGRAWPRRSGHERRGRPPGGVAGVGRGLGGVDMTRTGLGDGSGRHATSEEWT